MCVSFPGSAFAFAFALAVDGMDNARTLPCLVFTWWSASRESRPESNVLCKLPERCNGPCQAIAIEASRRGLQSVALDSEIDDHFDMTTSIGFLLLAASLPSHL